MNRVRIFFLIAVLTAMFSGILFAQTATELRLGASPISGTLRSGEEIWYSVRIVENGFLVIETSGTTDTYLEAYDDRRNPITENDDGGEELNARIEMFVTAGASYLFKLSAYGDNSGPFRIWAAGTPIPAATELRFGFPRREISLEPGANHWYRVRTEERGFVTVETTGEDFDTYLEAYDSQYTLLEENDDGGEGLNARLELLAEPNQILHFRLRAYGSDETGRYTIMASFDQVPADTDRNTERSRALNIRLGEAFPVFFHNPNESRWYRYEITRAGTRFMVQTRGNIDTLLSLYDNQGNLIADDDDSGEDYNALIFENLNPGVYYIETKTYSDAVGRCTLHAETR